MALKRKNQKPFQRGQQSDRALVVAGRKAFARTGDAFVALPKLGRKAWERVPETSRGHVKAYSRRCAVIGFDALVGIVLILFVCAALMKQNLDRGPISLSFLVEPIESSINRELGEFAVEIEDVVLRKAPGADGFEFRLLNLEMFDERRELVAQAPLAGFSLSGRSLLFGSFSPNSVELIGARLKMFYRENAGLALSFSRPTASGAVVQGKQDWSITKITQSKKQAETVVERRLDSAAGSGSSAAQIDLVPVVFDSFEKARREPNASTFLSKFGFRDSVVVFDLDGKRTIWQVPNFSVDLEHGDKQSVVRGGATVISDGRDWNIRFRTEQDARRGDLIVTFLFDDIVPRALAENFGELQAFESLDFPLQGRASLTLQRNGDVARAGADLQLARGQIVRGASGSPVDIDSGTVSLVYDRAKGQVDLLPSQVRWGGNRAVVQGTIFTRSEREGGNWDFTFQASDAVLGANEFQTTETPVQEWSAQGFITPDFQQIRFDDYRLVLPTGGVQFAGTVSQAPNSPEIVGNGVISAQSAETLKQIWPHMFAPTTRQWVGENLLSSGRIKGSFKLAMPGGVLHAAEQGGDVPADASNLEMEFSDVQLRFMETMPPLQAPKIKMTLVGQRLRLDMPEADVPVGGAGKVQMRSAQMVIPSVMADVPFGKLQFKMSGPLKSSLTLLNYKPFEILDESGLDAAKYSGWSSADMALEIPLKKETLLKEIDIKGAATISKLKGQRAFGKVSIVGGKINLGITNKAVDAKGYLSLNGVRANLAWQRIFGAEAARQPGVRISGKFDDAARKKLRLDLGDVLNGDVSTVVTIKRDGRSKRQVRVEANLTDSLLRLDELQWVKEKGRGASLGFNVVEDKNGGKELRDFQLKGDKLNIGGVMKLNAKGELVAYEFPEFSYDVISRLELSGKRSKKKIWDITAKSSTYDGRKFFRSLFSRGSVSGQDGSSSDDGGNVNLKAEFGTMIGHFDSAVYGVRVDMKKRRGRLSKFNAVGTFRNGKVISAQLNDDTGPPRIITAKSDDAGSAFRLIGLYPKIKGGYAALRVNLDGQGDASTVGTLDVRDFVIVGDQISEGPVTVGVAGSQNRNSKPEYQEYNFDKLTAPFSVGFGQFVLHDSEINGPLLGATMRGRIDFLTEKMDLGGTYIPLFGLNAMPGQLPIVGDILVGRSGEGVLGVTFAVIGPIANPEVIVNPVSGVVPGVFRQIFDMAPVSPQIRRREKPLSTIPEPKVTGPVPKR